MLACGHASHNITVAGMENVSNPSYFYRTYGGGKVWHSGIPCPV